MGEDEGTTVTDRVRHPVPEPNHRLRAAREACPSRRTPGMAMSRDELADLVVQWLAAREHREVAFDGNHLGKLERGTVRRPRDHYVAALCAILEASEAELGFSSEVEGIPDDVDRKTFLKTALGAGAGAWVAHHFPGHDSSDLAEAIAGPTAHYRRMEAAVSTLDLGPAVEAHLRLVSTIVGGSLPTAVGYGVLSETAGLAAWLSADRGDTGSARRSYATAVHHAQRAHHPLLVAYMRASLGHFAVESGDPRQGLTLLEQARHDLRNQDIPDPAQAWLASLHAAAHAQLGDRTAAVAELQTAEALVGSGRGEPRWPWVFAFDAPKAARYQASALARLGDVSAARMAYAAATPALTAPKPRALAQVDHAEVLAHAGQLDEACTLAVDALAVGQRYGSERVTSRVRAFRASLPPTTRDTTELDEALAALYTEDM